MFPAGLEFDIPDIEHLTAAYRCGVVHQRGVPWCQASGELCSSCYPNSRVSLSQCHGSWCLCARTTGYVPRQTPSCPAFFQWTGPSYILDTEGGIWLHTKGNVPVVLCLCEECLCFLAEAAWCVHAVWYKAPHFLSHIESSVQNALNYVIMCLQSKPKMI